LLIRRRLPPDRPILSRVTDRRRASNGIRELKARQSVMWGNGPYGPIAASLAGMHALVVDRLDPRPEMKWLDAACGPGNVALLAAEKGATVTGIDFTPGLIERARELAAQGACRHVRRG
jgi:2-polyprenyl-3-methyl-5-hydroxy-6-metoxy-1,4-benzoquinol methylase